MTNPFILNGYIDNRYFCDRIDETVQLTRLVENGNNVVITAPRRIGKTDLISHFFNQSSIKERFTTINVDIYATASLPEFVDFLGKAIIKALKPKGKKILDSFISGLKSIQSQITFDINGMPTWGLGFGTTETAETTLDEIFSYLRNADRQCIVAIDEFQQITRYEEPWRVEALLRTYIQQCPSTRFIFSGSQRHLMTEIFASPSRPFYASVSFLSLPKLDKDVYRDFCVGLFKAEGRSVESQAIDKVYDMFNGVTAYMQRVMNMLFSMTEKGGVCGTAMVTKAIDNITRNASETYSALFNQLTNRQRSVMIAIAAEEEAQNIQSAAFIKKYGLISASAVSSATKILLDKDMLTHDGDTYTVYDSFFRMWIVKTFL